MNKQTHLVLFCCIYLVACGGRSAIKPSPTAPSAASKPTSQAPSATATKPGGYYLDDGPGDNPPKDIDSIPDAVPKKEPLLERANKPYKALDMVYTPMTSYQPYKQSGVASWYGKRYHGKNTSSGEVYDMYSMSAAHTTLPLPSYVKVTNPANGRFVVVRVNDRGPFKSDRIIDLSYAAAYKLRFSAQGSTLVQVEAIDANNTSPSYVASYTQPKPTASVVATSTAPVAVTAPTSIQATTTSATNPPVVNSNSNAQVTQYFVQAGAFKNEANAESLVKKIQGLGIEQNTSINKVYNNGLYRLKLGPYGNKQEADQVAANILKQLNLSTITTNQ
jgi:rare lipoprotein A